MRKVWELIRQKLRQGAIILKETYILLHAFDANNLPIIWIMLMPIHATYGDPSTIDMDRTIVDFHGPESNAATLSLMLNETRRRNFFVADCFAISTRDQCYGTGV
jgi:hypothetical protein